MLTTIEDPAFIRDVETAILEYCKEVHELTYVEHGEDNIIALVNKEFVFRFPRNERSARRLVFETALLQKIKGKITTVSIPDVLKVHTRPLYIVAKYIPGDHLAAKEVQALSDAEQQAVGMKAGSFIHELNSAVSSPELQRLRQEASVTGLDQPWPQYFQSLFEKQLLPNSKLRPVVDQYYTTWKTYVGQEQKNCVIHDNLHPANLLFQTNNLRGVLDFGDTTIGSIESELRWLYLMGDVVLRSAADQYRQLSGTVVSQDHVRVWAIMHELSTFTQCLARQQTETAVFRSSRENLHRWIPGFPV